MTSSGTGLEWGALALSGNLSLADNDTFLNHSTCKLEQGGVMPPSRIPLQLLYAIVFTLGLLGNTLVIYVVLRFSKMQTVTNMYIVNLAIADECFLIGIPFLIVTMSLQYWPFGALMCKIYMTTTSINQITSSIFLTVMSADRYIAVCHPISAPKLRTPFISKVVSVSAWSSSALLMTPIIMHSSLTDDSEGRRTCNIVWPSTGRLSGETIFTLYSFILGFFIPMLLIFVFYFLVIRKLQTVGPKNKSKEKKKSHRKVTKLVLTVITVYVLCWLPYWMSQLALIFTDPNHCQNNLGITMFLVTGCLGYSNSAMNPILYAFLSDNFKKSFLKACTCATGTEVNATLHMENSVFPRKHRGSERLRTRGGHGGGGGPHSGGGDRNDQTCLIVSKTECSTSGTAMTSASASRSNATIIASEFREESAQAPAKNCVRMNVPPTSL